MRYFYLLSAFVISVIIGSYQASACGDKDNNNPGGDSSNSIVVNCGDKDNNPGGDSSN